MARLHFACSQVFVGALAMSFFRCPTRTLCCLLFMLLVLVDFVLPEYHSLIS